jgi:hypothetical protein
MMRRSWEYVRSERPLVAIDSALREGGSSFALAFADWALWNYYTGSRADTVRFYPEAMSYPEIVQLESDFIAPSTTLMGSVDPTGTRYYQVMTPRAAGGQDTLSIAAINCDLAGALALSPVPQADTIELRSDQPDTRYKKTGTGVYAKFSAADPSIWNIRFTVNGVVTNASPSIADGSLVLPEALELFQNYPNPFNPSTTIRYGLPSRSHVALTIFNTLGQQVATLVQGEQEAGYHEVRFDRSGLSSGVYFYRMQAGDLVQTRKLLLVR